MSEFLEALADLQDSVSKITKNADNPFFKSKYTDLNAIFEEVKPKIREKGFILIQTVLNNSLKTELIHIKTGEKLESYIDLLTVKPDMQQLGSAITYARRYAILPLLLIECEDDDGNLASGKTKSFDELETVEDFENAIRTCKSEKAVGALWFRWRDKFSKDSEEYKKLTQISSDIKLKLGNPDLTVGDR
jgi:hypothetical protein